MGIDPGEIARLYSEASLGGPENAIGFVMWRVVHRFQREIDRALAPSNLTHLQFTVLAMVGWLSRAGATPTQAEIARSAAIHPMQVSLMLKALEDKAMVRRLTSQRRATAKCVEITTEGLVALRAAMPLAIEVQRGMFGAEGRPGGGLLAALLRIEKEDPPSTKV